ncbi:MAG: sigma-70 family RNA polymerase sigma factor [Oscillospiraceae bacterium]|nr:sigma-70 family RNA polymerase sigma factor [Oscillospiraceae bacterium]
MTNQEKKYRVPIEMYKEYAAQIGINPNEIRYIMLDGKPTSVYFVEIADEQLYHELMRPIWQEEKALQRSKKCAVSNENGKLIRCNGNCSACPRTKSGTPISIDAMEETGGFRSTQDGVHRQQDSATYAASTEDIVMDAMLLEALWHHIGELSEENQTIITMFCEGASEREIAEAIGMSQKGVNKRKKAIFEVLKNNLQDFF